MKRREARDARLIDADKLIEHLKDTYNHEKDVINSYWLLNTLIDKVDEVPTAYDADKVVEQLESESARWQDSGDAYNDEKEKGVAIGFRKAIKIVKGGEIDGN